MAITDQGGGYDGAAVARAGGASARVMSGIASFAGGRLHPVVKLYLVMVVVPFSFHAGPLVLTGVRTLMLILVIPMMARLLSGKCGKVIATDYLFFGHLFWIMVTLAVNNPTQVVQNFGSTGVEFLGGYLLGRNFIRNRSDMLGLFRFAVFLVICTLPFAIYETITGTPLILRFLRQLPGIGGSARASSLPRMGLERVQLAYATPIHYGVYCTIAFSVCFVGLRGIYTRGKRVLATAAVGLGIFLSLSSGALLPMMLQMFLIGWNHVFRKNRRRWMLLLGFTVFCYVTIDLLSNRTPYRVFMTYATFSPGTAYWRAAINEFGMNNVWANPIFGIGLNDWQRASWMHSSSVDNFWLLMAMRHGIPGFLLVASGYAMALWRVMRCDLGEDIVLNQLRLAWVFTFSSMAFTLTTVHVWTEIYSYIFFYIGAAMWLLEARPEGADPAPVAPTPVRGGGNLRKSARDDADPSRQAPASLGATPDLSVDAPMPGNRGDVPRYSRFPPKQRDPD